MAQRKYHLLVLGCQMNKSDAERLERVLQLMGFEKAASEAEAQLIGVVSCSVRQTAMDRIHGKLRLWNEMKKERPLVTLLTGCVLPHDRERVAKAFDIFLDIQDIPKLPQEMARFPVFSVNNTAVFELKEYEDYFQLQPQYHEHFRAYVPIMTGCDKFCTYCAVPYTRGRERSRRVSEVLSEIEMLASHGCKEITLLGQNVNSYHPEDIKNFSLKNPYKDAFAALLWEINQIHALDRVHFTASHPKDMGDEVIDALALPKHVRYLHLPMQSGDNDILQRMNRKYTIETYLELIQKIRSKVPDIALGTDIIVGFCGETVEQFEKTVEAYSNIRFDIAYPAMYSPRSGTVAEKLWKDDVPKQEKKRRWKALQTLMERLTLEKNQRFVGETATVLVDRFERGYCFGNSRHYRVVKFPGDAQLLGQVIPVRIMKALTWVLEGQPV